MWVVDYQPTSCWVITLGRSGTLFTGSCSLFVSAWTHAVLGRTTQRTCKFSPLIMICISRKVYLQAWLITLTHWQPRECLRQRALALGRYTHGNRQILIDTESLDCIHDNHAGPPLTWTTQMISTIVSYTEHNDSSYTSCGFKMKQVMMSSTAIHTLSGFHNGDYTLC